MIFPAIQFTGVGADLLRRRTGQLRDAPRKGKRGESTGTEQGQSRDRGWVGAGWMPSILEQALSVQGNVTRACPRGLARSRGSLSLMVGSDRRFVI